MFQVVAILVFIAATVHGQDCYSTTGTSVDNLVESMSEVGFPLLMRNDSTNLLEYSNIQAKIDSLNATSSKASWYVCHDSVNGKTLEMRAICSDGSTQDCAYVTEYNGQLCASSSICQVTPFVAFSVNCQGLDKDFETCALNYCTREGIDNCFPSTADRGVSRPMMIASAVAWLVCTMMGMWESV